MHYAPIDFERTSLTEGLTTAGLKRNEPAFFTWLGVTQYLTRDSVLRTLREVAAFPTADTHSSWNSMARAERDWQRFRRYAR